MQKRPLYIPTEKDIYDLQKIKKSNGINHIDIYGYLVAKAIEKLIVNFSFLRDKNISVTEMPEIIHGVCYVYNQEIHNSEYAKYDADLCSKILTRQIDNSITILDNLKLFAPSVQFNRSIISTTLDILDTKLKDNPKYRFIYNENELLDAIFKIDYEQFENLSYDDMVKLINIDPIYALKFDYHKLITEFKDPDERLINYRKGILLESGIRKYKERYDLSEYVGYDYESEDMTNPQKENVKKLIKYLHS